MTNKQTNSTDASAVGQPPVGARPAAPTPLAPTPSSATGMAHFLKTDPDVFNEVWCGRKKFELRRDDRDYQVGDLLVLKQTVHTAEQMAKGAPLAYTGIVHNMRVNYILRGPAYGLPEGWVIMS